jgi:stress response protein SCP2
MIFGELLKQDDVWVFHAIGQGTNDHSIDRLAASFK